MILVVKLPHFTVTCIWESNSSDTWCRFGFRTGVAEVSMAINHWVISAWCFQTTVALKCQAPITKSCSTTFQKNWDLIYGTTVVLAVSRNHTRENFCVDFFAHKDYKNWKRPQPVRRNFSEGMQHIRMETYLNDRMLLIQTCYGNVWKNLKFLQN
jgi:hypothetical protein